MGLTFSSSSKNSDGSYSVSSGTQTSSSGGATSYGVSMPTFTTGSNGTVYIGSTGGSNSYGSSSGGISTPSAQLPVIQVKNYVAMDGSKWKTQSQADKRDAAIKAQRAAEAEARRKAEEEAFNRDWRTAVSEEAALEAMYDWAGNNSSFVSGNMSSGIGYKFVDPVSGKTKTVSSLDALENLYAGVDTSVENYLMDVAASVGYNFEDDGLAQLRDKALSMYGSGTSRTDINDYFQGLAKDYKAFVDQEAAAQEALAALDDLRNVGSGSIVTGDKALGSSGVTLKYTDPYTGRTETTKSIDEFLDMAEFSQDWGDALSTDQRAFNSAGIGGSEVVGDRSSGIRYVYTDPFTNEKTTVTNTEDLGELYAGSLAVKQDKQTTRQEESDAFIESLFNDNRATTVQANDGVVVTQTPTSNQDSNTFVNELGQTYTMEDVEELGTRSGGMLTIGNTANRVATEDGGTGYVIGSGNNDQFNLSGDGVGYNLDRTADVAKGMLAPANTYETSTPQPVAEDRREMVPLEEKLGLWTEDILPEIKSTNPDEFVSFPTPYKAPSTIMDEAIESGVGITEGLFNNDIYSIDDTEKFLDSYAMSRFGYTITDEAQAKYGTGIEGFNNLVGAGEAAKAKARTLFTKEPELAITPDGTVVATDSGSFQNVILQIGAAFGNNVISQIAGGFVGDMVFGAVGGLEAPLYSAYTTRGIVSGMRPIENQVYIDENGEQWIEQVAFGTRTFMTVDEALEKADTYKYKEELSNIQFGTMGNGSVTTSDDSTTVAAPNPADFKDGVNSPAYNVALFLYENRNTPEPESPSWRDYYDSGLATNFVANAVMAGVLNSDLNSTATKAIRAATAVSKGADPLSTVVDVYGSDLAEVLPPELQKPTQLGARVLLGDSLVNAAADIYGQEVVGDSPAAISALKGAVAYDQGKDPAEVAGIMAYHYIKNGGELPEFEFPEFLKSSGDFDWEGINIPDIDLGFIEDGAKAAWDFVKELVPDMNLPDLSWDGEEFKLPEFEGIDLSGLGDALKGTIQDVMDWVNNLEFPDIPNPFEDVEIPNPFEDVEINNPFEDVEIPNPFEDVEINNPFEDVEINNPFEDVEINNPLDDIDLDLPDFDLPDFNFGGSRRGTGTDLDAVLTQIQNDESSVDEALLSRLILNRRFT